MNTTPRWKAWLAAGALFALGAAAGSATTAFLVLRAAKQAFRTGEGGEDLTRRAADRLHARMVDELELDEKQAAHARRAIDEAASRLGVRRQEMRADLRAVIRDMSLDIAVVLTPEQRAEFRSLLRSRLEWLETRGPADDVEPPR